VNKNARSSSSPTKPGVPGENVAYLKLEKPRFLFLDGSGAAAAAPAAATAALANALAMLAGASTVCAASSTNHPTAVISAPAVGACSSAASVALGDGGGDSTSRGELAPPSLFSSSSDEDKFSGVVGGESPCFSRSRYSSLCCSRHSCR
jgi:hypothetical protein